MAGRAGKRVRGREGPGCPRSGCGERARRARVKAAAAAAAAFPSGLLSDSHGFLIVRAEEVVRAVLLHSLTPILSHIEHWTGKTRAVRNKRLPSQ